MAIIHVNLGYVTHTHTHSITVCVCVWH